MKATLNAAFGSTLAIGLGLALMAQAQPSPDRGSVRIPESTHNLLLEAKVSGNLDSYQKGLRGAPDHVVYDAARGGFVKESQWHEYGVGFGADLGIVPEDKPAQRKPLFDPSCLSAIISERLGLGWVKETEPVTVAGPSDSYRWTKTDATGSVRVIRQIDQKAMQLDLFNTMKGRPAKLAGIPKPQ